MLRSKPTYVLVHGAWHGGWCWSRILPALRSDGAEVYPVTLTGLGDRVHLLSRDVGLGTHIADVAGVIEAEELSDVVLVGHSYAGFVVSAVADRVPERIARLVYLDAIVPRNGECAFDRLSPQSRERFETRSRSEGDGWLLPVSVATADYLGLVADDDIDFVLPRLAPHPMRTLREPVTLGARFRQTPRTYINCIGDRPSGQPRTAQADGIDDYHELRTGHDAMVTDPQGLVALLRRAAATPAA